MTLHKKSLIALISIFVIIVGMTTVMPISGQELTCSSISLERSVVVPADILRIDGTSPEMEGLSITATTIDGQTNIPILIATDPQPFVFFAEAEDNSQLGGNNAINTNVPTISLTAPSSINVRSAPSTNDAIIGALSAGESIIAETRNDAGDWVQIQLETDEGTQSGWVFVSLFTVNGDVNNLPIFDPNAPIATPAELAQTDDDLSIETADQPLYLVVPFHPNDLINGGEISVIISDGSSQCDPLILQITPLPDNVGAFEQVVNLTGEMLALRRESMGVTREALLAVEPSDLSPTLVSLAISQRLYDGDNPDSLIAMQEQINNGSFSEADIRFLDAIIGRTGIVTYLEAEVDEFDQELEARWGNTRVRMPIASMNAQEFNTALNYPGINNAADLAREMSIATSADFRLNRGATGQVLTDLGVVTAVGGLVTSSNPITNFVFSMGGNIIYLEKSRLEFEAYSGPVRFVDFNVNINPGYISNENSTEEGRWTVTAIVESQQWQITRARAYDATRFFSQGASLPGPVDSALSVVDVITAVCDRDSNPCGERPIAITIPPHRWVVRDMDQHQFFEVARPSNGAPYSYALVSNSNRFTPINAGTSGIIVSAPRSQFGLYQGDGFDSNARITVSAIDINITTSTNNLTLAEGEIREVCHQASVHNALQESGRNDLSYEITYSGTTINGETNRDEEFCFDVGPIESEVWIECELEQNHENFIIELRSLAEDGPRGGAEWNPESMPLERNKVFTIRVDIEDPEEPEECGREGVWYLVFDDFAFNCPTLITTIPIASEPIPLTVDTLNAGTSVFGMLDQVLTMPGASLLPPSVADEIAEADAVADDLQTTQEEFDPERRLFTSIPDIAQEGATYTEIIPVDPTGEMAGEVLLTMTFTTDTTFTGSMVMNLEIPSVGECNVDAPFEGYFEPSESEG